MFVTRFWFFLLTAVLGLVLAVMYLLQDSMDVALRKNVDDVVQTDFAQVQSSLKLQARQHLDRLSEVTASEPLREALAPLADLSLLKPVPAPAAAPAGAPAAVPAPLTEEQRRQQIAKVKGILGDLLKKRFQDVRRPFLLAMNRRGEVVAAEGSFPPADVASKEFGLYGFPAVRAVLRGYERDDVWFVKVRGKPYLLQVAGRPVVHQGKYLGAVFLGRPIDDEFAQEIRGEGHLAGQVFFFVGEDVVAKSVRGPEAKTENAAAAREVDPKDVMAAVKGVAKNWLEYAADAQARRIVDVGAGFRGLLSPMRGSAVEAGAGFLVARPMVTVGSPWTVLKSASKQGLSKVPVGMIAGVAVGALALAMLWIFLERDRPLRFFRKQAEALKGKENERFNAYLFRGKYRQIAVDINAAIDKTVKSVAGAARMSGPDVASILGPGGKLKLGASPIAGMDDDGKQPEPQAPPPIADMGILGAGRNPAPYAPPAPPPAPPAAPAPPPPQAHASGRGIPVAAIPPVVAAPAPVHARPASPFAAPAPAAAPLPAMAEPEALDDEAIMDDDAEPAEEPTRIVAIPSALLEAAQGKTDPSERRAAELKKLFNDFRSTKMQCGESVDGLTFDKFKASVEKNRSAILQKQKCKDVQFSVYIKAGKAALKATPVM